MSVNPLEHINNFLDESTLIIFLEKIDVVFYKF